MARSHGLPNWHEPAAPSLCNATPSRPTNPLSSGHQIAYCPFGYGTPITPGPDTRPSCCALARWLRRPVESDCGPHLRRPGSPSRAAARRCRWPVEYACFVAGASCQSGLYFTFRRAAGTSSAWENAAVNAACQIISRTRCRFWNTTYLRPRFDGYPNFSRTPGSSFTVF